jgi:hypothetical protein
MDNAKTFGQIQGTLNHNFETISWGIFFIWWGMTDSDFGLFKSLPHGTGWFGIGLLLLGLNAARALNSIPVSGFTSMLGVIAFTWGGLELTVSLLHLPFELPAFAILLIVLGAILLARELLRIRTKGS